MTLDYTALVTVEEVRRAFMGAGGQLAEQLADKTTAIYDGCIDVIHDVTSDVERHCNRQFIVRSQDLIFRNINWQARPGYENADEDLLISAWVRQWPVAEVVSVDTQTAWAGEITLQTASDGGQLISYDPDSTLITEPPYQVNAFCGFRRRDQVLSNPTSDQTQLPTGSGEALEGLTVLPDTLPGIVRRVALRLAISEMRQQYEGLVGVARRSKRMDQMTVETQHAGAVVYFAGAKTNRQKELSKLDGFRYLNA